MNSLLRQIVAGPRTKHAETGLDLCYVTSNIIVTSGPSQTYPRRAYRNPLDQLVAFLDAKHGDGWAIWEFRAEGTGYPDEAVYGRIRHYPWPDHHPPPFGLVPLIMASMREWLVGEDKAHERGEQDGDKALRVVVVHCKAGKGRSGTVACSYLISQCGWTPHDALARFTERRMRPSFGSGVTIPSQLRWVDYVDRWTRGGRKYFDGDVEVVEVHVRGLRHGVKVSVEGFADEGKKIREVHTFTKEESIMVDGAGAVDSVLDVEGYEYVHSSVSKRQTTFPPGTSARTCTPGSERGGRAVIFKPAEPIRMPNSDVNIAVERRYRAPWSMGLTMVTAVAHAWFNAFFEGRGPEQDGKPDDGGVFEVRWDQMDGIKGSSQKGARACDSISVVWRYAGGGAGAAAAAAAGSADGMTATPGPDEVVPQMRPADWKGEHEQDADAGKRLGLRVHSPHRSVGDEDDDITKHVGQSSVAH